MFIFWITSIHCVVKHQLLPPFLCFIIFTLWILLKLCTYSYCTSYVSPFECTRIVNKWLSHGMDLNTWIGNSSHFRNLWRPPWWQPPELFTVSYAIPTSVVMYFRLVSVAILPKSCSSQLWNLHFIFHPNLFSVQCPASCFQRKIIGICTL